MLLGLLTLLAKPRRQGLLTFKLALNAIAIGSIGSTVAALVFDLALLESVAKTELCTAAGDSLVLQSGTVLQQTTGGACALASGCACLTYLNPIAAGAVECMNFPNAPANACPGFNHVVSGMIRMSIYASGVLVLLASIAIVQYGWDNHHRGLNDPRRRHSHQQSSGVPRSWGKIMALHDLHQERDRQQQQQQPYHEDVEGAHALATTLDGSGGGLSRSRERGSFLLTPIPENAIPYRVRGHIDDDEEDDKGSEQMDDSANQVHVF